MNNIVIITVTSLSSLGILASIILYIAAKKFKVHEDPRIDEVEDVLPAANCGGCGFAGCRAFAEALVKRDDISDLYCPVGGNEVMSEVAKILGKETEEQAPLVAVVRCYGTPENSPRTNEYEGPRVCSIQHGLYTGESGCPYGCLGHGDCVEACDFDAIHMNPETRLPEVIDDKCTACNACVLACPRDIIELRKKNREDRKIFVSCINEEKGVLARKSCKVACIACGKCVEVCPFDAITMENNLAYIDPEKCKLCRKCPPVCPTNAIHEINFPPRKEKKAETGEEKETSASEKESNKESKKQN